MTTTMTTNEDKKKLGFARMDKDTVRGIAQRGGRAAHAAGTAREWSHGEAQLAGRKGAYGRAAKRRGVTLDAYLQQLAAERHTTVDAILRGKRAPG